MDNRALIETINDLTINAIKKETPFFGNLNEHFFIKTDRDLNIVYACDHAKVVFNCLTYIVIEKLNIGTVFDDISISIFKYIDFDQLIETGNQINVIIPYSILFTQYELNLQINRIENQINSNNFLSISGYFEKKSSEVICNVNNPLASLNNVSSLVFVKSLKHEYLYVNSSVFKFCNAQKNQNKVLGKNDFQIYNTKPYAKSYLEHDKDIFKNKRTSNANQNIRSLSYSNLGAFTKKIPLIDNSGKLLALLGYSYCTNKQRTDLDIFNLICSGNMSELIKDEKYELCINNKKIAFSSKKIKILLSLISGLTAKQTGDLMFLSPRTIEYHLAELKWLLNCKRKSDLINTVIKSGIMDLFR